MSTTKPSTALLTDQYELTMLQAALADGTAHRPCVFEVFARGLPHGRRYGVVAGTGRLLQALAQFRFSVAELDFLAEQRIVNDATLEFLADYRFEGDIDGYAEGEIYFPGSPVLTVRGSFAQAVLLETLVLSIYNYDTAVASAASRMSAAARGRTLAEMGSRRTHEEAAVAAARAAYIGGFAATSNLEAGRRWGIPTMGTAAHAFTLVHDSETDAFTSQLASLGTGTTLLVDTYDVERAVRTAVQIAGPNLGAVRLDSGDLIAQAGAVRALLDDLGAPTTKIVVTSDLDEYAIAALQSAPVDSYGVGTSVVTGSGAPAAGLVYKLVARQDDAGDWVSVAKASTAKASRGGAKTAFREIRDGHAHAEVVHIDEHLTPNVDASVTKNVTGEVSPPEGDQGRRLTTALVRSGQVVVHTDTHQARDHHARALAELPDQALRLSTGEPALPTLFR